MGQPELSPRAHVRQGLRVNFPAERRAAQRRRGARKSCSADGSDSADELIVKMSESARINPCFASRDKQLKKSSRKRVVHRGENPRVDREKESQT